MSELFSRLEKHGENIDEPIHINWGDASLPTVTCTLQAVLNNNKMATFLGGESTLCYCITHHWVIEFYHDGETTLGFEEDHPTCSNAQLISEER